MFGISAGSATETIFGPKRTNLPYFLCRAIWISWACPVRIHERRGMLVSAARRGPGTRRRRIYERRIQMEGTTTVRRRNRTCLKGRLSKALERGILETNMLSSNVRGKSHRVISIHPQHQNNWGVWVRTHPSGRGGFRARPFISPLQKTHVEPLIGPSPQGTNPPFTNDSSLCGPTLKTLIIRIQAPASRRTEYSPWTLGEQRASTV